MNTNKAVFSSILIMVLILCSCGGLTREDFKDSTEASVSEKILSLASLSPSGHNTQPWTVRIVSEDKWIIGWDKNRALTAVDPGNRELIISLGAFCEALKIASEKYGFAAEIKTIAKGNFDNEIAEITFSNSGASDKNAKLLERRRIVRKGHLSKPLSAEDKDKLKQDISSEVYFFDRESEEGKIIEKAVLESNMVQTKREDALTESFRESSMKAVKEQLSSYGTWIIITTEKETPPNLMTAGADFLKIGIAGIEEKIVLHPMTQPIEEDEFKLRLKEALPVKGEIQFILRSGYVEEYPLPVSVRMEAKQVIRK